MIDSKTVAIWAPLRYANYGDDMQAIAYALFVREKGYNVKVFQLEESLSKHYKLESCSTLDELFKDVNICIIAGGALLTPFTLLKRLVHKTAIEYERDFKDLHNAAEKYSVKVCALSMGGDGKDKEPTKWYSSSRINFFKSNFFINGTVRLKGDIQQMAKFGKEFSYAPDMLFRSEDYFDPQLLPSTDKVRVGFNFKKGKYLDKKFVADLIEYAQNNDDMEFYFTTTHMEHVGLDYQFLPKTGLKNVHIARYESPNQLLGVLASMDVFVTSMLHVGMTGLAMGTPFVSYRGPGKTKSFLKEVGGDWAILPDQMDFESMRREVFLQSKQELYNRYNVELIEEMKLQSKNHYKKCAEIIEKYV